jgi:uncharacterized membrane protein
MAWSVLAEFAGAPRLERRSAMNSAHIHLMLNHVPMFGALAVTILCALALLRRQQGLARGGLLVAVLTAIVGVVVYLTGEPAEELVEDLPGVSEAVLETHEEVALVATVVLGAFGLLALVGLVAFRHGVTMGFARALLAASLVPLAAMAYTAYLGGQVRHSEIRPPGGSGEARDSRDDDDALRLGPSIALASPVPPWTSEVDTAALMPLSLREEHESLTRALEDATREPGRIGEAARKLAKLMRPHLAKEEALALPLLGVLRTVASGETPPDPDRFVGLAAALDIELPTMLEEHQAIAAAALALAEAARAGNRPEIAGFGEQLVRHAGTEEEITYPAAVLVGRYLSVTSDR